MVDEPRDAFVYRVTIVAIGLVAQVLQALNYFTPHCGSDLTAFQ